MQLPYPTPSFDVSLRVGISPEGLDLSEIEINANPWRLDLDWRWCQRGLELGCLFSIDPDAHSTDEIDNVAWGVMMARKGAVPKDRVLNTLSLNQFAAHLEQRKHDTHKPRPNRRRKAG
jgi:DNA polymerase (family 10)